jgi:molecular chaperone DnaK
MQASHKLAEMMYQQAAGAQAGSEAGADTSGKGEKGGKGGGDDDVVDADFEEVK